MEEIYIKPDNRKPWQKNRVLAILVILFLYFIELIRYVPLKTIIMLNKLIEKPERKDNQDTGYAGKSA